MRTTANYIHMYILFLNMQVLDVGLKLNIAVFYNGTARCYIETKLVVIINRHGGIVAALTIWSSQSSGSLSVTKFVNYLIISERLCLFSQ